MHDTLRIISPVDGSLFAERPLASHHDLAATLDTAAEAQARWRETPLEERLRILSIAVDIFEAQGAEVTEELSWQMGRPVSQGGGEVRGFAERARYMLEIAPQALAPVEPADKQGFRRYILREPLGVVIVVAPWNFPYMTAVNSVWPALAAGNAVIHKPARQTALCGERLERVLAEAGLPSGVFRNLHTDHAGAAFVMRHEAVGLVCFTGSVDGGRAVQASVADGSSFPAVNLELGGKDPAYVRPDADLRQAAAGIADGVLFNAGQSCCSVERIYVHAAVYDEFLEALAAEASALRLGHPLDPDTSLGPMVSAAAADLVRSQVEEALSLGARPLLGEPALQSNGGGSQYLAPHMLVDVDHRMRVMVEESFGPVAGVMRVESDAEAVALMNDSVYGLTASIWTRDVQAAERIGTSLQTGTVFMNRCDYLDPALAWTGVKHSGRGCTLSLIGYEHMTRPKSFHLKVG